MFDLKPYFTAAKIAKRFQNAPVIKDVVMDTLFPPAVRQTVESPVIPVSDIKQIVGAVPVVHRGAASIPLRADNTVNTYVEPLPVRIHDDIDAVTLNNLKLASSTTLEQWANRKQLALRQTARLTAAVLCAQAVFNGKISYPLLESNGSYATYTVTYGDVLEHSVVTADKWDDANASLMGVYKTLEAMSTKLDDAGHGGEKVTFAGATAYATLLVLIDATDKPKIPVRVMDDGTINIGGHKIKKMAETYPDPENKTVRPKLPPKEVRMVATGNTALFYGPIDDLDANLQAMPMFIKPHKVADPSKYTLIGESKPLPAVAPEATCKATVLK